MALVIPPGFGLAAYVLTGDVGTAPYVTTMGLDLSAAGGDFVTAADLAFGAFATAFDPVISSSMTLDRVNLSVGQDGPGGSVDSTVTPTKMSASGTREPSAMAPILRKITNQYGRFGRGRMFLPGGLGTAQTDEAGTLSAAARVILGTACTNFLARLNNLDSLGEFAIPPVVLHSEVIAAQYPPTPVVDLTPSNTVGWIRGRIR